MTKFYAYTETTNVDSEYGISTSLDDIPCDSSPIEFSTPAEAKKYLLRSIDDDIVYLSRKRKRIREMKEIVLEK